MQPIKKFYIPGFSFDSGETQQIIFRIVSTHFSKSDKVDEVGENETVVDEMGSRRSGNQPFSLAA